MLPSSYTGITFANNVTETRDVNVFTYRNFYNGGGVATGDLDGDGRPEVMLTSNLNGNHLYRNEGGFRFRDITEDAGVKGRGFWATGVTFADVNGDGLLDIYVCYAGTQPGERRANEFFVNQGRNKDGVPTFREMATRYGIADEGFSTQAAFFDYDRDGDLDLYLLNNSSKAISSFGLRNIRDIRNPLGGDKLFRNDGGRFTDVSEKAGIYGSEMAFGLGVAVSDVNRDGWPDIYVSNDFFERDYLYINNRNGTFTESLEKQMPYISYFSMGLDIADINNDGWPDVYTTDMLPEDEYRLRTTSTFESWDAYQAKVKNGFHHQFMRNMLQLNNGNGTFSDIGQLAGVARTDWSWSALLADFDLDGNKDIYITNGIARDVTSQDYVTFLASDQTMMTALKGGGGKVDFKKLIAAMSSTKLPHYAFHNNGNLTFSNESASWGLDARSFANGAAYADLDGDGALDLVVNNVNQEAFVYRNNARALTKNHYLQVKLEGLGKNRYAVGAHVSVTTGNDTFYQEVEPSRGFQSSMDLVLTFGVGAADTLDVVKVDWPDGRVSTVTRVAANQRLVVKEAGAVDAAPDTARAAPTLFGDVTSSIALDFEHHENDFVDFDRERLMPRMLSREGPVTAVADVNGDGLDDIFIGGAKDQASALFLQEKDGRFASSNRQLFEQDKTSEDVGAVFFDANGDHRPDLYVATGGTEFSGGAPPLDDRLYLNEGGGNFRKAQGALPQLLNSGSRAVSPADFDGDGAIDLFVGGRSVPGRYGVDPQSVLLHNDGRGHFTDVTDRAAPGLSHIGMVSDALWKDVDGDGRSDLVLVGEWMPITIFRNAGGRLEKMNVRGLDKSDGWWNRIVAGDFNGDGRQDFVVGNFGLNARLQASASEPVSMYVNDFAHNGFVQQIVTYYNHGQEYPLAMRDELTRSLTFLKDRYTSYRDYARQTVADVFPKKDLSEAVEKKAYTFATSIVRNNGNGSFSIEPLPLEAQISPVYGILASDFDGDGKLDVLLGGNFEGVKPEIGSLTAGYGLYLRGDGKGRFSSERAKESGFFVPGEVRDITRVRTASGDIFIVARNNDRPLVFRVNKNAKRPAMTAGRR